MTPFQLRKRLKRFVRHRRQSTRPVERIHVTFVLPDGTEHVVRTEPGYTLTMASQLLETPIDNPCPDGHCGQCQVQVLAGAEHLRQASEAEGAILREVLGNEYDPGVRLACHARLTGSGAVIRVNKVWRLEDLL